MKILQTVQSNLATAGISPGDLLSIQSHPLDAKILFNFLVLNLALIWSLAFTLYEAKTFAEYIQSTYMASLAALCIFFLLIIILNAKKIFITINRLEDIANTSELTFNFFL